MNLKLAFIEKSFRKDVSFTELCTEYGISTKTGYKWKERFFEEGLSGLEEKSRKPISSPNQLSEEVICEIIRIKQTKQNWGPKKIRSVYTRNHADKKIPSLSTFDRILKKAGFVDIKKRKRHINPERIQNRIVSENRMISGQLISKDGGIHPRGRDANL